MALPPALCERDFRLFVGGSFRSAVGGQLTAVAMAWQIYLLTDSALQVAGSRRSTACSCGVDPQFGQFEGGLVAELGGARLSAVMGGLGALALVGAVALLPAVRRFRLPLPIAPAPPAAPAAPAAVPLELPGGRAP